MLARHVCHRRVSNNLGLQCNGADDAYQNRAAFPEVGISCRWCLVCALRLKALEAIQLHYPGLTSITVIIVPAHPAPSCRCGP